MDKLYDNLNRLTRVSHMDGVYANYTYDANNRLLSESRLNNTAQYTYNAAGLVTSLTNSRGASYTYSYSLDGNQIQKTDSVNGITDYVYNKLGQLKSETVTKDGETKSTSYEYDTRGNRISMNSGGIIGKYVYDTNNRLLEETKTGGTDDRRTEYTYDKNGNLIMRNTEIIGQPGGEEQLSLSGFGDGTEGATADEALLIKYTYDGLNRLESVETDTGLNAIYRYNANNRRMIKKVNGETTVHLWDGDNVIIDMLEHENRDCDDIAKYYRGVHLIAQKADTGVGYYTYDGHGSVTGYSGDSYEYDAFGNVLSDNTDTYNPFRYCGEYTDAETGLIYLRNRYYDPIMGRFITEDPAKDGLNWYVYCDNNPVMLVDPMGLDSYAFLGMDQSKNNKVIRQQLKEANSNSPVHIIYVKNAEDFYNGWNGMGMVDGKEVSIDNVIINMHGDVKNGMGVLNPNLNTLASETIDMAMLESKAIDTMLLLSCNGGLLDVNSTAHQMMSNNNIKYMIAADGYVQNKRGEKIVSSIIDREPRQTTDNRRAGQGFSLFRNQGGRLKITTNIVPNNTDTTSLDLLRMARISAMKNTLLWGLLQSNFPNATERDIGNAAMRNPYSIQGMIGDLSSFR